MKSGVQFFLNEDARLIEKQVMSKFFKPVLSRSCNAERRLLCVTDVLLKNVGKANRSVEAEPEELPDFDTYRIGGFCERQNGVGKV